jgi:hypothetical protein
MTDKPRASLAILYRSGARIDLTCDDYSLKKHDGALIEITLVGAVPKPLLYGMDDISAIWRTDQSP